jgi:hypothetical protein
MYVTVRSANYVLFQNSFLTLTKLEVHQWRHIVVRTSTNLRKPEGTATVDILVFLNPHGLTSSFEDPGGFRIISIVTGANRTASPMLGGVHCRVLGVGRIVFKSEEIPEKT